MWTVVAGSSPELQPLSVLVSGTVVVVAVAAADVVVDDASVESALI